MQLLRSEPMQPISIAQIPIKLSPGQLSSNQQRPVKLATGLQPLLQKQQPEAFRPTTPLEQKVVEVVRALEGTPTSPSQRAVTDVELSLQAPQAPVSRIDGAAQSAPIVSQAK